MPSSCFRLEIQQHKPPDNALSHLLAPNSVMNKKQQTAADNICLNALSIILKSFAVGMLALIPIPASHQDALMHPLAQKADKIILARFVVLVIPGIACKAVELASRLVLIITRQQRAALVTVVVSSARPTVYILTINATHVWMDIACLTDIVMIVLILIIIIILLPVVHPVHIQKKNVHF